MPIAPLDIESTSEIFTLALRHPLWKSPRREVALTVLGEHLYNETTLLGDPFSFSPGAQNGKSTVTAVRVAFEWTESTAQQVLALRSRFSIGLHWTVTLMSPLRLQPQLEVYWGYRLTDVETADDNLQDLGLHIRFVITAF